MMYRKPDADGRYPLSMQEYEALRTIFGCVNALDDDNERLKARCQLIKGGWRDMRLLATTARRLMENLLCTVPAKKLLSIRRELQHTICEIKVKPVAMNSDSIVYVSQDALLRVCNRAMQENCYLCDKSHREARQHCDLYKDVQACFPYDFEQSVDCPFSGMKGLTARPAQEVMLE